VEAGKSLPVHQALDSFTRALETDVKMPQAWFHQRDLPGKYQSAFSDRLTALTKPWPAAPKTDQIPI